MNMPKSRDIQAKMPSPKVIFIAFWLVTVKVLNSYKGLLYMLENIKAVLFDLDGTLVDSMWMWKDIDIEYLGRYEYELPSELQKEIEGMSLSETAVYFKERFAIPESLEEIKSTWMDMARDKYTHEVPLKPGAREFLVWLRQQGIRTGIASSNGIELVETVLKAQGIREYLESVRSSERETCPGYLSYGGRDTGSKTGRMSGLRGCSDGHFGRKKCRYARLCGRRYLQRQPAGRKEKTCGLLYRKL